MKSNKRRHFSRNRVAEMTVDCVAHHFSQFLDGFSLRGDGVSHRGGNISAIGFILLNFKNDFAHNQTLFCRVIPSKSEQQQDTNCTNWHELMGRIRVDS